MNNFFTCSNINNTLASYVFISVLDEVLVPLFGRVIDFPFSRVCIKLFIWILVVCCCHFSL